MKKAISAATSAALLASLLATAVAPSAFASITQTSAGNVALGTTSAGTATITFVENSAAALNATGTMSVTICDNAGFVGITAVCVTPGTVSWAGTPVLSGNVASLGASVSLVGNVLNIKITGHDNANIETLIVSGLKVSASSTAAPGAVKALIGDNAAGVIYGAFVGGTATATGKLAQAYGPTTTSWIVAVDSTSPCIFGGTNSVTVGTETLGGVTVSANNVPVAGQQTFTTNAMTINHLANEVVTQTVVNCTPTTLGSPATVVTAAAVSYLGPLTVYPGESNGSAGNIIVKEPTAGAFFAKGTTLTYTIAATGVVFSGTPTATAVNTANPLGVALSVVLASDRKSVTVTIPAASGAADPWTVTLSNIKYDVASTVPGGTFVDVNVALSGGLLITGNPAENAVVFRGVTASAPTPTVYIGENNQATGLITFTEAAAGFFQSGTGSNNVIRICTVAVDYSFTFAPYAKVTTGDLLLRNGLVSAPVGTAVAGTQSGSCYEWTVWAGSTVASTIQIGNSTFSSGPIINVDPDQAPGLMLASLFTGNGDALPTDRIAVVGFAVAVFRNQVVVTALSQPVIPAGAKTKAGAIQVAETGIGQLKMGEDVCVEILPRASNGLRTQDTFMQALTTADLPVVTATGGVILGPVRQFSEDCLGSRQEGPGIPPGFLQLGIGSQTHALSFHFGVVQQSTTGTGKLVIDNINLVTTADAVNGPVLLNVYGFGGNPTFVEFQSTISNAKIGTESAAAVTTSGTALGATKTGPFSISTKVAKLGQYVTWKFSGGSALVGKSVQIWVATKNSAGKWSAFAQLTARRVDASGNAYFWWKTSSKAWISVRAGYLGTLSVATQARWL